MQDTRRCTHSRLTPFPFPESSLQPPATCPLIPEVFFHGIPWELDLSGELYLESPSASPPILWAQGKGLRSDPNQGSWLKNPPPKPILPPSLRWSGPLKRLRPPQDLFSVHNPSPSLFLIPDIPCFSARSVPLSPNFHLSPPTPPSFPLSPFNFSRSPNSLYTFLCSFPPQPLLAFCLNTRMFFPRVWH